MCWVTGGRNKRDKERMGKEWEREGRGTEKRKGGREGERKGKKEEVIHEPIMRVCHKSRVINSGP